MNESICEFLDVFPGHAGCYYILAFICFVLNKLEEATIILQMGRAVDPTFEPLDGNISWINPSLFIV
jgi:hypothetical protein